MHVLIIVRLSIYHPPVPSNRSQTCEAYQSGPTALSLIHVEKQVRKEGNEHNIDALLSLQAGKLTYIQFSLCKQCALCIS